MPIILGGKCFNCDRQRNTNKSEYISPCLAPLVHNADQSSFCRFEKLLASFLKKVRQFSSSRTIEVSDMSTNDLENKNWLANSFRNFRKRNDSPENFSDNHLQISQELQE